MKYRLLYNWNLWRIIRVILSLLFIVSGIITLDYILVIAGVFLFIQALLNTCISCVNQNCKVPQS